MFCHHQRHISLIKKTSATISPPNLLTHRRYRTHVSVSVWISLFKLLQLQVKVRLYINKYTEKGFLTSSPRLPEGRRASGGKDVEGFGVMWSRCFWVNASVWTCHLQNNLQMNTLTHTRTDKHGSFKESRLQKHLFDQNNSFLNPNLCRMLF